MKILATLTLILLTSAIGHPASAQESARKFDLQASSPKFWRMIPPDAKLQTVATGFGFTGGPFGTRQAPST